MSEVLKSDQLRDLLGCSRDADVTSARAAPEEWCMDELISNLTLAEGVLRDTDNPASADSVHDGIDALKKVASEGGEPWYGHKFKQISVTRWECECGKVLIVAQDG